MPNQNINLGGERRTYPYLLSDVFPWLNERSIPSSDIHRMLNDNPRRIFKH
jgi:predicted metal-dependent phosphotriesterase family hydrolase